MLFYLAIKGLLQFKNPPRAFKGYYDSSQSIKEHSLESIRAISKIYQSICESTTQIEKKVNSKKILFDSIDFIDKKTKYLNIDIDRTLKTH